MPNVEKTPRQTIRVEKDLWSKAGAMVGTRNRGQYIREFLRWLTHETDELPARPAAPASDVQRSADGPQSTEV